MHILLVEDDRSLSMAVSYQLKKAGMAVTACYNGGDGLEAALTGHYDLIVLDRMLPQMDGVALLTRFRMEGHHGPVLMLTAMDGIADRVEGLNAGADDYLVKPFAADELMARINALMRRPSQWAPNNTLAAFDLVLNTDTMELKCGSREVGLSKREGQLLQYLICNKGRILPRNLLLDRAWQGAAVEDGNLDLYIHFLRKKLKEAASTCLIRTVRGIGYELTGGRKEDHA